MLNNQAARAAVLLAWFFLTVPAAALDATGEDTKTGSSETSQPDSVKSLSVFNRALLLKNQNKCKEAIEAFREFNRLQPGQSISWRHLAECYVKIGQDDWAVISIKKAIKFDPENLELRVQYAQLLKKQSKFMPALLELQKVLSKDPHHTAGLYISAGLMYRIGKFNQAADMLRLLTLTAEVSGKKDAYYLNSVLMLGDLYLSSKQFRQALYYYNQYREVDKDNLYVLSKTGHLYRLLGDLPRARELYSAVLRVDHDNTAALASLGEIAYVEGSFKAAHLLKQAWAKLDVPSTTPLKKNLVQGMLYAALAERQKGGSKSLEKAAHYFDQVIEKEPRNLAAVIFRMRRAIHEKNAGEYSRYARMAIFLAGNLKLYELSRDLTWQIIDYKKKQKKVFSTGVLEIDNVDVYEHLGSIYFQLAKEKRAVAALRQALFYLPEIKSKVKDSEYRERRKTILMRLIQAYLLADKQGLARGESEINRYLRKNGDDDTMHFLKGLVLMKQNRVSEADDALARASELAPEKDQYSYYRAVLSEIRGDDNLAEVYLKECLQKNPKNASALNFLGYLYLERNVRLNSASRYIESALRLKLDSAAFRDSYGWSFHLRGQNKKAFRELYIAMELANGDENEDPVIYDHLAVVLEEQKKPTYALYFYRKAWRMLQEKLKTGGEPDDYFNLGSRPEKLRRMMRRIKKRIDELSAGEG